MNHTIRHEEMNNKESYRLIRFINDDVDAISIILPVLRLQDNERTEGANMSHEKKKKKEPPNEYHQYDSAAYMHEMNVLPASLPSNANKRFY
ncbi:hypothetical protein SNEBB_008876 [Seison nebaliae]|nr:hypothetical protein SNEBB_008876 [Seison nebaliae]